MHTGILCVAKLRKVTATREKVSPFQQDLSFHLVINTTHLLIRVIEQICRKGK